jgi:hypothetical protein
MVWNTQDYEIDEFDIDLQLIEEAGKEVDDGPMFTSDICNTGTCHTASTCSCPACSTTGPCPC